MINKVISIIDQCQKKFVKLDSVIKNIDSSISDKTKGAEKISDKLKADYRAKLNRYVKSEVTDIKDRLEKLIVQLRSDEIDSEDYKKIKPKYVGEVLSDDIEGYRLNIIDGVEALNKVVSELNDFDYDEYNPPLEIKTKDEGIKGKPETVVFCRGANTIEEVGEKQEFSVSNYDLLVSEAANGYPQHEKTKQAIAMALGLIQRLSSMENAVRRYYSEAEYAKFVDERRKALIEKEKGRLNAYYENKEREILGQEDDIINKANFRQIYESGQKGTVDVDNGSFDFKEYITLGDMEVTVDTKPEHKKYFEKSPVLSEFVKDGKMSCPLVLDLKNSGNILVNINEPGEYSSVIFNFIHEILISYLMSFPAKRISFLLIDVDDRGDFSRYAKLKDLGGLVGGGIVRDERDLDGVVKDMEKTMHTIYDNKIRYNAANNIFEYNELSVTNPESITVMAILNFPKGFNPDTCNRLAKIIDQGNRAGIFTVLFNNRASVNRGIGEAYDNFIATAKRHSTVFNASGDKIVAEMNFVNKFNTADQINSTKIDSYFKVLADNSEKVKQKNIQFTRVLDYIDKQQKSAKGIKPADESIDLPIGMRGNEFLSFELSTSGASAHAVAIGGTGSGKSNLLHAIVLSACYKYSPDELNIYLVDFKGGVEFKFYEGGGELAKQVPHIKLTGLTSDPDDGLAILSNILKELHRRENLFRRNFAEDIIRYNEKAKVKLPRLLVIIDEVQELFERNESLGQEAIKIMSELFKKGRAFGISFLWVSQNVPKVAGIREVIGQIGTRICLKLNNLDDASDLDIKPERVSSLNKIEKGLALMKEMSNRGKDDCVEFRVAYAENSQRRLKFVEAINKKWAEVTDGWKEREPLFVVGNDNVPQPNVGQTKYTEAVSAKSLKSKSSGTYFLEIGQNYITGKPFGVNIGLRGSQSNLWMAGSSIEEIRDLMGYSMLSVLMENIKNKDISDQKESVYYVNGEIVSKDNPNDLYYVLPEAFSQYCTAINSKRELADLFVKLLRTQRERSDRIQDEHPPIFVFIHKLQAFVDLLKDNMRQYDVSEVSEPAPAANSLFGGLTMGLSGSGGDKMTFAAMFKEVFSQGADTGIHIVFSVDTPSSVSPIEREMAACSNKILLKGVRNDDILRIMQTARYNNAVNIEGLGYCYENNDLCKFKPYRYFDEQDAGWFKELIEKYKKLRG